MSGDKKTELQRSLNLEECLSSSITMDANFQAPSPLVSFTDFLQGSSSDEYNSFSRDLEVWSMLNFDGLQGVTNMDSYNCHGNLTQSSGYGGGSTTPFTPNSSVSSLSSEVAVDEELGPCKKGKEKLGDEDEAMIKLEETKEGDDDDDEEEEVDKSKKVNNKSRKKSEKRQKEPRFAFMTKSEVDNLEDGYRWRKYGQKAVKNSPYPRNYYRCTTQKCPVKKRVERSYQDPSIVITTYEGQHTHQCPATMRSTSHLFAPSFAFNPGFLMHQDNVNPNMMYIQSQLQASLQNLQYVDNGFMQEYIAPSFNYGNQ